MTTISHFNIFSTIMLFSISRRGIAGGGGGVSQKSQSSKVWASRIFKDHATSLLGAIPKKQRRIRDRRSKVASRYSQKRRWNPKGRRTSDRCPL